MNIFAIASERKAEVESKKRAGKSILATTVTLPFFKGVYRRGKPSPVKLHKARAYTFPFTLKEGEKAAPVKGVKVAYEGHAVKPLSGTFIMSYCTCLAACIVKAENALIAEANKAEKDKAKHQPLHSLNCYIVEAVIAAEGFSASEYSQGKVAGAKRIAAHLRALADDENVKLQVKVDDSLNIDLSDNIVNAVLTAI